MIYLKLAYRNLAGAGLRMWLSVIVLSMSYVIIIWYQGFLDGWNRQALHDMIGWEIGQGQYWQQDYDPYDVFSFEKSHAPLPAALANATTRSAVPILATQATIYPQGRMQNVILKGIPPGQTTLSLPTSALETDIPEIPVLIGTRMARSANLHKGDTVTLRWRDVNGAFDAADAKVVDIMKTTVSSVDHGQFWLPLGRLQAMMQMPGEATIIVMGKGTGSSASQPGWVFRDQSFLSKDFTDLLKTEKFGSYFINLIMLSLALLAIFDTQVLAIFRRRKEIGTLIALGMTRRGVIWLFTLEGTLHGVLAALVAAIYGIPLLSLQASRGIGMPEAMDSFGLAIASRIYPVYSAGLVAGAMLVVMVSVTIVSFLPARRIATMNPTDAIRGKIS